MLNFAAADKGIRGLLDDIGWDGEGDAGRLPHLRSDLLRDANHLRLVIQQWPARIARINRSVGLDSIRNLEACAVGSALRAGHRAMRSADDTLRHSTGILKRVANGRYAVSNLHR